MRNKNCAGLSIVEALVTMVILMITLGGVYQIFHSNSLTYRMQEGLARVQENGRFAMDFLVNDIRMAGYLGCISTVQSVHNILNDHTQNGSVFDFSHPLYVYEAQNGTWSPQIPLYFDGLDPYPDANSDILRLTLTADSALPIARSMPDDSASLKVAPLEAGVNSPVKIGDIVLITDCIAATIFYVDQIVEPSGSASHRELNRTKSINKFGNSDKYLKHAYKKGAEIVNIENVIYYIAKNNQSNLSLYKKKGSNPSIELVEGVEKMKILLGVSSDGGMNIAEYYTPEDVEFNNYWSLVRSIKIGILSYTVDKIPFLDSNSEKPYRLIDEHYVGPFDDERIRRVFSTTIGIRNRLK